MGGWGWGWGVNQCNEIPMEGRKHKIILGLIQKNMQAKNNWYPEYTTTKEHAPSRVFECTKTATGCTSTMINRNLSHRPHLPTTRTLRFLAFAAVYYNSATWIISNLGNEASPLKIWAMNFFVFLFFTLQVDFNPSFQIYTAALGLFS